MTHPDALVDGLRCAPGTPFFHWLVRRLREALDVRYAFIGEYVGEDARRLHVLATSEDTDDLDHSSYIYELDGTAAAEPADADGFQWYAQGARSRFPDVQIYQALGIEGIACLQLADGHGRPLGMLSVLDTKPFRFPEHIRRVLLGVRARTSGDLELRRVQRERQMLTETAAAARHQDALPRMVEQLARVLDVRSVFVAELLDDPPTRARTLVVWDRDALAPNVEYALADTPCALVYERDVVLHPRDLGRLYPRDAHVQRLGAQAYFGMALHDRQGRPIGHVGVLHDRPLHDALSAFPLFHVLAFFAGKELERARLARATAGEPRLVAGEVAHDFNNLLTGILAHSGLALDELAAPEALRARLEAIQSTAQRAADLARDMLDAPDAGRGSKEPVDLGAVARETAVLLAPAIPAHVRVDVEVEPALPPVRGNGTQLRQIVMNLLLNASEAMGDRSGLVQVTIGRDRTANGRAGRLLLTVRDSGTGMTPAIQARIFEPAFTTKARGRGIGLAIVRKLVEAHAASISVDSTPQAGTQFTVSFPVAEARPMRAAARPAPAPAADRPVRALLVDDDEGVRLTTAHMLRRLGCEVVTAGDGDAALAILETNAAALNLVLLDMAMPGMSGEDLAAAIRQRWPTLPMVVMSGYATQDLSRRLAQHTALNFLQKPFGLDALRSCLAGLQARTSRAAGPAKATRAHA